ncbi:BamA/TamA family outer membrane protein [Cognataquiflexum rubidum]|uniref:BamA/TamA family outer membrane protein n=1 Tax=Cognataquiflexum rubidum TaxID=2922273 RepID=UPI001F137877|nr:BamA/TamA family outer membrane protein [Cognataquiflexum rubidum]MCH6233625.1 outer membrane protein assembly factor [Cognataquiflexum rubidum]
MKVLSVIIIFLGIFQELKAQDTTVYKPNRIHEFKWVPLPAVGSNPANGWMFGLAPSATWYMGNPADTKMSNFVGNFLYTTKKQWIFSSRSNIFLDKNKWILVGDWRYFITSQPTFGLGSSAPNEPGEDPARPGVWRGEQQMDFSLIRFYETVLRRIGDSKFYLGMGYHFDLHSKITNFSDEENAPELEFSHDAYNIARGISTDKYILSGITLNAIMENRDIAVSPYEKNFALLSYKVNPTFLGSVKSSSTILMDYRHYFNLSQRRKRHLIAVWGMGNFLVSGELPYMNLPSIGWDMFGRSGRAYAQGRFRGESMVYTEAEYRFPLQQNKETFGGTVFVNAGSFSSRDTNEKLFEQFNPGYGLGLRVMINKKNRTTITADYGWGQKGNSGFYLNVNESF